MADEAERSWTHDILWKVSTRKGEPDTPRVNIANVVTVLANDSRWADVLAYDEFAENLVTLRAPPWRPVDVPQGGSSPGDWTDEDTSRLQAWLSREFDFDAGPEIALKGAIVASHRHRVHPVRDWLLGLRWDGKRRLPAWLVDVFGANDTGYTRSVGQAFLVSCVARVMSPGCKVDTVPVLEGAQGIGKSKTIRALVGDAWFFELGVDDLSNKDAMQVLRRKWIGEMPEVDGWSKAEASTVKSYVSRQVDTYRPSYGKGARDFPRQTVFIGTTNQEEYLKDETGGRRWWPIRCRKAETGMVEQLREQLWAEARARFESSERWHVEDPELIDEFRAQQAERYQSDPWEENIGGWLGTRGEIGPPKAERGVTLADVLEGALHIDAGKRTKADANRAAACLRRLGWVQCERESRNGARVRPWRPASASAPDEVDPVVSTEEERASEEGEEPRDLFSAS
jgi:putative DNA primase/helicase